MPSGPMITEFQWSRVANIFSGFLALKFPNIMFLIFEIVPNVKFRVMIQYTLRYKGKNKVALFTFTECFKLAVCGGKTGLGSLFHCSLPRRETQGTEKNLPLRKYQVKRRAFCVFYITHDYKLSLQPFLLVLSLQALVKSPSPALLQALFRHWKGLWGAPRAFSSPG